jgi:hypothetical protein
VAQGLRREEDQSIPLAVVAQVVRSSIDSVRDTQYLSVEDYILPALADWFLSQVVVRVSNRGLQIASPDYSYLTPFLLCTTCILS